MPLKLWECLNCYRNNAKGADFKRQTCLVCKKRHWAALTAKELTAELATRSDSPAVPSSASKDTLLRLIYQLDGVEYTSPRRSRQSGKPATASPLEQREDHLDPIVFQVGSVAAQLSADRTRRLSDHGLTPQTVHERTQALLGLPRRRSRSLPKVEDDLFPGQLEISGGRSISTPTGPPSSASNSTTGELWECVKCCRFNSRFAKECVVCGETNWGALSSAELKAKLKRLNLPVGGNKAAMVKRIIDCHHTEEDVREEVERKEKKKEQRMKKRKLRGIVGSGASVNGVFTAWRCCLCDATNPPPEVNAATADPEGLMDTLIRWSQHREQLLCSACGKANFDAMSASQLKEEVRQRDLPVSGNRKHLLGLLVKCETGQLTPSKFKAPKAKRGKVSWVCGVCEEENAVPAGTLAAERGALSCGGCGGPNFGSMRRKQLKEQLCQRSELLRVGGEKGDLRDRLVRWDRGESLESDLKRKRKEKKQTWECFNCSRINDVSPPPSAAGPSSQAVNVRVGGLGDAGASGADVMGSTEMEPWQWLCLGCGMANFGSLVNSQLKALLRQRALPVGGRRKTLLARLVQFERGERLAPDAAEEALEDSYVQEALPSDHCTTDSEDDGYWGQVAIELSPSEALDFQLVCPSPCFERLTLEFERGAGAVNGASKNAESIGDAELGVDDGGGEEMAPAMMRAKCTDLTEFGGGCLDYKTWKGVSSPTKSATHLHFDPTPSSKFRNREGKRSRQPLSPWQANSRCGPVCRSHRAQTQENKDTLV